MSRWRVLIAEPQGYCVEAKSLLETVADVEARDLLARRDLLAAVRDYDALVVRLRHEIDGEVMDAAPRLRAIATATTGLDHIDLDAARQRNVAVVSLRGETVFLETIAATAEHTWALLLALVRALPAAAASVSRGEWDRQRFRGRELKGRRLGIVGLGRIGRRVARYAHAFEMRVAAFDPYATNWLDGVQRRATLDALLGDAEVLSLHVPLTAETSGLIGERELAVLPAGALLVNTSRGAIVDECALVESVERGHLGGVAVDVVADERDETRRAASPLLTVARRRENVIVTPHIGGATIESMAQTELFIARKLARFLSDLPREVPCQEESA